MDVVAVLFELEVEDADVASVVPVEDDEDVEVEVAHPVEKSSFGQ